MSNKIIALEDCFYYVQILKTIVYSTTVIVVFTSVQWSC